MTHKFLAVKTNALRRKTDFSYTLTVAKNEDALCEACALYSDCPLRQSALVKRCTEFMPVFVFADGNNLDKAIFNTLRIGKSWSDRLSIGQTIALYDKHTGTMSKAKVINIDWDIDKDSMLANHAAMNHLGMELSNPATELEKILQNNYGKGFYSKSKGLTAIYLSKI
ncbi:hypothetical protein [Shewanella glacialipiscicola]|uniref:hypothetical protein n=1 Tax=Shewanella glacialipiscicola TaxID=614069 RepID=UPI003D7A7DDA